MPSHNLATVRDVPDRRPPAFVPERVESSSRWADLTVVLLGVVMTMCAGGYEFGHGDHDSYFPEAIHVAFPRLLARDWFTTQTLQYHSVFSWLTAMLMRLHVAQPAFLVLYLALVVVLHVAWLSMVRAVGGSRAAYVASVLLWWMIGAGLSLAAYHMLQDSELLAANIASVSMLVGFAFWLYGRAEWAGLTLGISGLFHLNYAVVAVAGWCGLVGLAVMLRERQRPTVRTITPSVRSLAIGTLLVLAGSLFNILHALPAAIAQKHGMPLADFLDVYVHFRHPHHYDPRSWPLRRWLTFGWTIPLAVILALIWGKRAARPTRLYARRESVRIYIGLAAMVFFGLVFAGLWFVSATLVQLSLSRFAVYLHLFGCTAGALLLCDVVRISRRGRLALLALLGAGVTIHLLVAREFPAATLETKLGLSLLAFTPLAVRLLDSAARRPRWAYPLAAVALLALLGFKRNTWRGEIDHDDYRPGELAMCDWIKNPRHTPVDAIFLTSPAEQIFCAHAERAVVVAFKNPPQLSTELPAWRDRMCDVMGATSLSPFIHSGDSAFEVIDQRYEALPPASLLRIAGKYHASYVLVRHRLPGSSLGPAVYTSPVGPFYLYRLPTGAATKP